MSISWRSKLPILIENLRRIAKLELNAELKIHPSPPWNYRNRTRLKVHSAPQFALGYYKFNSHELLPVEAVSHQLAVDQPGDCCQPGNWGVVAKFQPEFGK